MPYAIFSSPVNASLETVWNVMQDKVANPGRYNTAAENYQIVEKDTDGVLLRQMEALNMQIEEKITLDENTRRIRHDLVNNNFFTGKAINTVIQDDSDSEENTSLIITYAVDWEPIDSPEAQEFDRVLKQDLEQAVQHAVINTKTVAEEQESNSQSEQVSLSEQSKIIAKLGQLVIDEKWEQAKKLLSDNVLYRVGSSEPVYGKQAVVDYLSSLFKNTAKLTRHDVRKIWNEPGIVSIEMDAKYTINQNNRHVSIACCDIYRLSEGKVNEWRVYADLAPFNDNQ